MNEKPICRLCLSTAVVNYCLQEKNGKEMLRSLTGISLHEDSDISRDCCVKCWYDLRSAYRIQQKFIESDEKFQQFINNRIESTITLPIKTEEADDFDVHTYEDDNVEAPKSDDDKCEELTPLDTIITDTPTINASSCSICEFTCDDTDTLTAHIKEHFEKEQECNSCLIKLPNFASYKKHLEDHHTGFANNTYICKYCSSSFRKLSYYRLHLSACNTSKVRESKQEPQRAREPTQDRNEIETIGSTIQQRKACPICFKKITSYNLHSHIKNHETAPVVCHLCGKVLKNAISLRGHMNYVHRDLKLRCETCGKQFKRRYVYMVHIKQHTGIKGFTCHLCGKQFYTQYNLNNHTRGIHIKQRLYSCQYCKRNFSSRYSMKTHERQHTNETPYVCEECGEGFRQRVSLRTHRKSKHNIEESKTIECPDCHKMFHDEGGMKVHFRIMHE